MSDEIVVFDPVSFSKAENKFLLDNLGKPPIVAMKSVVSPVNPKAVRPILDRVFELDQLEKEEGTKWVGVEALKKAISIYLEMDAKWERDHQRNKKAPRYPSLYSYDAKGRGHRGGPGSDSHQIKTYFGPAGERIPFAVELFPDYQPEWKAPGFTEDIVEKYLRVDQDNHRIECRIPKQNEAGYCGHTESYKADSRSSYNAARARMSKHLRKATDNVELHRETHTNEFGG